MKSFHFYLDKMDKMGSCYPLSLSPIQPHPILLSWQVWIPALPVVRVDNTTALQGYTNPQRGPRVLWSCSSALRVMVLHRL